MAAPSTARDPSSAVAAEALKKNTRQPITGDDRTKLGMAAAMQGPGTAAGELSSLPLAGSLGGLGARGEPNIQRQNQRRTPLVPGLDLINKLPVIGSLADGLGGRDTSNLNKREAQIGGDLLGELPFVSDLFNTGSKVKREIAKDEPLLSDAEKAAIAEETEVKKAMDPVARIKKLAAIVADVRGVTSTVKRRGFSKSIIDSAKAKVDNQLDSAALEDTECTVRPEHTSFPPGMPAKTTQGARDKRTDDPEEERYAEYAQEGGARGRLSSCAPARGARHKGQQNTYETNEELKRQPLDLTGAIPAKDLVEIASGLNSVLDTFGNLSSAVQNRNS